MDDICKRVTFVEGNGRRRKGYMDFVVYTIIFAPTGRVVYVGCTCRDKHRINEHLDIRGGAPRVAIAFAQNRFQPRTMCFRFEIAWSGSCTIDELHAIEQHFINKYNTRIYPRPTNGITKDIDLMSCDEPLQLNINHACKCTEKVLRAVHRIQHDSAIAVKMNTMDALLLQQCLEVVAHNLDQVSGNTAYAVIQRACTKYEAMANDVSITEFHSDLNDVKNAYVEDDGEELKDNTMILLRSFNMDKRGTNYSLRPSTVCGHFLTLLRTLDPSISSSSVQPRMINNIDVPDVDGRSQKSSESIALDGHLSESMRRSGRVRSGTMPRSNCHFNFDGEFFFKMIDCGNVHEKQSIPLSDLEFVPKELLPLTQTQIVSLCFCGKIARHENKGSFKSAKSAAKKRHTTVGTVSMEAMTGEQDEPKLLEMFDVSTVGCLKSTTLKVGDILKKSTTSQLFDSEGDAVGVNMLNAYRRCSRKL